MGLFSAIGDIVNGFQQAGAVSDASKARIAGINQATGDYTNTVAGVNPQIQAAGDKASGGFTDAANTASSGVTAATNTGINRVDAASQNANSRLDPYAQTGAGASTTLGKMLAPDGSLMHTFGSADMQNDDGYKFRLQQGQEALERNASARGASAGGGILKALTDYGQGAASQEYQNAFNRFTTGNRDRYDMLSGAANRGLAASSTQAQNDIGAGVYGANAGTIASRYAGDNTMSAGRYAGDVGIRSADIQGQNTIDAGRFRAGNDIAIGDTNAAEHIGRANAWGNTIRGVGNLADGVVTGGFSGGGGFSPMGAMTGVPQSAPASTSWADLLKSPSYQPSQIPQMPTPPPLQYNPGPTGWSQLLAAGK